MDRSPPNRIAPWCGVVIDAVGVLTSIGTATDAVRSVPSAASALASTRCSPSPETVTGEPVYGRSAAPSTAYEIASPAGAEIETVAAPEYQPPAACGPLVENAIEPPPVPLPPPPVCCCVSVTGAAATLCTARPTFAFASTACMK